jgi:sulfate permease, SulP family
VGLAWNESGGRERLTIVVSRSARRSGIPALLPIVEWLPSYDRRWLRGDLAAGIAVTALIVPKDLGYAGIAGVPLQNGLYAAAAGAIIYALFCTSRQISTGPSSSLAAVAGGAVVVAGLADEQAAELVAAIALITGLLFLALALLRLGWISRFLSKAVITGFLAGAAVDVVIGELPKLTGTEAEGENSWRELGSWIGSLGDVHWPTVVVGVLALALILAVRFLAPAVPGALVLVVVGILGAYLFDLEGHGVALVGDVPSGLPTPQIPDLELVTDNLATVFVASFALVLIGFSQTAGDARAFAMRHRYRIDIDQESVAQGMANAGAGLVQGMPVSTSLSASSLNESAGARTPMASLITGGLVILTLLFLAPLFSNLPKAVLGALIIDAVVFGMIDLPELRRFRRVAQFDFWIAVAAILGVLSSGVLGGVLIGVVLSLGWLIHVATAPPMPLLGRAPGTHVFRDLDENPGDETFPGIVVLRLDSGLFFATAQALEDRVRELTEAAPAPLRALVLDLEGVNFIDSQGAEQLATIHELLESDGATLRLARVKPNVLAVLSADGFVDRLGADRIHGNVQRAVVAQLAAMG